MPPRFGGRAAAGRVTAVAVTGTAGIVGPAAAGEGRCGMTGGTVETGRNMGRHGIHHTRRRITIVAGSTIVDDAGMIEACRHEAAGSMTDTAILVGVDMIGFLGRGETSVMTGCAVIHDTGMIETCRQKTRGHVTVAAVTVGRYMKVALAGGGNTIMTIRTVIHDTLVFESGVGKGSRGMAHRAILGNRNVVGIGLRARAGGGNTVVTGYAVIHDTGMIEHRRGKAAASHVTGTTILGGYDVRRIDLRIFAGGGNTVMTGNAADGEHGGVGVVDKRIGKSSRVMAKSAIGRGCRMRRSGRLSSGAERQKIAVMAGGAITGDAGVSQHRCWCEPGNRMAQITILISRHMACCFYQLRINGKELGGMTTCAAIGDALMDPGQKRGRGKVSGGVVTITTYIRRRDVILLLVYRPNRDIVGIAIVAALTIAGDTRVREVYRRLERIRGGVANHAVLDSR